MLGLTGRPDPDVVAKKQSGKVEGGSDDPSAVRFRVRRREAPSPSFTGSGQRLKPRGFLGGTQHGNRRYRAGIRSARRAKRAPNRAPFYPGGRPPIRRDRVGA